MHINKNILSLTTTNSEMAKILRLSTPRITQLIKEGVVLRDDASGKILVFPSLANYYKQQDATGGEEGRAINYEYEHARLEQLKADKEEVRLAQLRGQLYEASTVELTMTEIYTTLRTQLLGLPQKIAFSFPEEQRARVAEEMTRGIEGCLAEMASFSPEMFTAECEEEQDAGGRGVR